MEVDLIKVYVSWLGLAGAGLNTRIKTVTQLLNLMGESFADLNRLLNMIRESIVALLIVPSSSLL